MRRQWFGDWCLCESLLIGVVCRPLSPNGVSSLRRRFRWIEPVKIQDSEECEMDGRKGVFANTRRFLCRINVDPGSLMASYC